MQNKASKSRHHHNLKVTTQLTITINRGLIGIILFLFAVLTAVALWQHGYWGIVAPHFKSTGPAQVLVDLVIALSFVLVWIWQDTKKMQKPFWPWLLLTLTAGSFGPLIYFFVRKPYQIQF